MLPTTEESAKVMEAEAVGAPRHEAGVSSCEVAPLGREAPHYPREALPAPHEAVPRRAFVARAAPSPREAAPSHVRWHPRFVSSRGALAV